MKKLKLLFLISFTSLFLTAQEIPGVDYVRARKFFNSIEDYRENKPVAGFSINECSHYGLSIFENGDKKKIKPSKLQYSWFCNEDGILMRVFDGEIYFTLVEGSLCYYIKLDEGGASPSGIDTYNIGSFTDNHNVRDYYSETPSGEIKKLTDDELNIFLEKNGLKSKYDADKIKREAKDSVDGYKAKSKNKIIKYFRLINAKTK